MSDKETLELAYVANACEVDGTRRDDLCECDWEVGNVPCQYCAICDGLDLARRLLKENNNES